jgi:hypothetical protein
MLNSSLRDAVLTQGFRTVTVFLSIPVHSTPL